MPSQRPLLALASAASFALVGCSPTEPAPDPAADASPLTDRWNVLFIVSDDLNDWVGCLGTRPDVQTPNIDRLARRGVLFAQAFAPAPVSGPSRHAILTGRSPRSTGRYTQRQARDAEEAGTLEELPATFARAGYRRIGAGRINHLHGLEDRWDEYVDSPAAVAIPEHPLCGVSFANYLDWGFLDDPLENFAGVRNAEWMAECIAAAPTDRPSLFALGIAAPHVPMYVPARFGDLYDADSVRLPETIDGDADDLPPDALAGRPNLDDHRRIVDAGLWDDAVRAYLASVSYADYQVGLVLDALDASPIRDRTVVVFVSDNGWHLGQKGCWRKMTLWNESTHVPMIVSVPGMAAAGSRCDRVVEAIDLHATLVELCGLPRPKKTESVSLLPLLENPAAPWDETAVTWDAADRRSVRTADWCYIRYAEGEELYDRRNDPHEWRNLAADANHGADLESMRALLARLEVER